MGGKNSRHENYNHHHAAQPGIFQQTSPQRVITTPAAVIDPMQDSSQFPPRSAPMETIRTGTATNYDIKPTYTYQSDIIPTSTQGIPPTTLYESTTNSLNEPHIAQDLYK